MHNRVPDRQGPEGQHRLSYEEPFRLYGPEPSDVKRACRTLKRIDAQPRASGASAQDCAERAKAELILRWLEIFVLAFNPDQPRDERGRWTSGGAGADSGGALPKAVKYLEENDTKDYTTAEHPELKKKCAALVRTALEKEGIYIGGHGSAKNYGDALEVHGFEKVADAAQGEGYPPRGYSPEAGDVVVIQAVARHRDGHMAMYTGTRRVSYFKQPGFWPHSDYAVARPRYAIYRLKKKG